MLLQWRGRVRALVNKDGGGFHDEDDESAVLPLPFLSNFALESGLSLVSRVLVKESWVKAVINRAVLLALHRAGINQHLTADNVVVNNNLAADLHAHAQATEVSETAKKRKGPGCVEYLVIEASLVG